jgi:hypothetical protein
MTSGLVILPLRKGTMDRNRIRELALQTLEKQKADIDAAIAEVREFQDGNKRITSGNRDIPAAVAAKRRSRTSAERALQAKRMREYWAAKRGEAAKIATAPKTSAATGSKRRAKTEAEKKALSEKMKAAWKRRKAAAKKAK